MSKTQITTGKVRFSYVNAFTPKQINGAGDPKYSVTLIIPKSDTKTVEKIKSAMEAAKSAYLAKKPGKKLPANLKSTFHDGDEPKPSGDSYGPECNGCYVMAVSSKTKPVVVYPDKTIMTEPTELYSGCYGRAVINFYVYDTAGSVGLTAGLNGLMKLEDGEPLAGGIVTDSDWDDDYDDNSNSMLD